MKEIKINYGCFSKGLTGWTNVDNAKRHLITSKIPGLAKILYSLGFMDKYVYEAHSKGEFKNVIYGDATKRMKFESESVGYIYSSHMLEHLYPRDAVYFLTECKRVLKKNGKLRILLPDLEAETKKYIANLGKSSAAKEFSMNLYANDTKEGYVNSHKWMYDKYSLTKALKDIGFSNVVLGEFKKGEFPDVEKLDNHEGSLILEAKK